MCDPITAGVLAGAAALKAGGAYLDSNDAAGNAKRAVKAGNAGTQAIIDKNAEYQGQANDVFGSTLKGFEPSAQSGNLAQAQTANTNTFNANAPTAEMIGGINSTFAPKVVQDSAHTAIANRMATDALRNTAFGNLTGYSTNTADNGFALNDANRQMDTINNFAGENARIGQVARQAAVNNSQKAPSPVGGILSGLGSLAAMYAGLGMGAPAAAAGGPGSAVGTGIGPGTGGLY
jgi:hypothetical protein